MPRCRIGQTRWSRHIQARRLERETVARVCASLVREIPLSTCGAAGLCCRCCRGRVLAVGAQLAGPRAIYILVLSRRTRHTGTTAGPRGVAAITCAVCNRHARRRGIRIRRTSAAQRSVLKGSSRAGIALARRSEGQEHEHGCPHRVAHHHLGELTIIILHVLVAAARHPRLRGGAHRRCRP